MTYKQIFMLQFSNKNGNIKKNVKAEDVWNSLEEFLRLVLPKVEPPQEHIKKIPVAKVWSRKGRCPDCGIQTGGNHQRGCQYRKEDLTVLTLGGGGGAK